MPLIQPAPAKSTGNGESVPTWRMRSYRRPSRRRRQSVPGRACVTGRCQLGWEGAGRGGACAEPRAAFVGVVWVGRPAEKPEVAKLGFRWSPPWRSSLASRNTPQTRACLGRLWCSLSGRVSCFLSLLFIFPLQIQPSF